MIQVKNICYIHVQVLARYACRHLINRTCKLRKIIVVYLSQNLHGLR